MTTEAGQTAASQAEPGSRKARGHLDLHSRVTQKPAEVLQDLHIPVRTLDSQEWFVPPLATRLLIVSFLNHARLPITIAQCRPTTIQKDGSLPPLLSPQATTPAPFHSRVPGSQATFMFPMLTFRK